MTFTFDESTALSKQVAAKTEAIILDQLNELISRGLLILHHMGPTMVLDENNQLKVNIACKVLLKDQEYIERLEKENKELKEILKRIHSVV